MTLRKSEKEKAEAKVLRTKKAGEDFIILSKKIHKQDDGAPVYNNM